jgi:hypothetical protein
MIMLSFSACSQDPIEKCVAAQMEDFDANLAAPKQAVPSDNDELTETSPPPVDGMKRFRVEAPDGVVHLIDVPQNSSSEQIIALAEARFSSASSAIEENPETRTEFKARAHLICMSVSK